jgi:hypothetical protein
MRKEFEMSEGDMKELLEACRPVPMIMLQCGNPPSQQENANRAWCRLGDKMGFDGMTVEPTGKGDRFFTAEARERVITEASTLQPRKIITSHVHPPIPTDKFDWCAYYDDVGADASPYGWGRTEAEAIADLKENFIEDAA